MKRAGSAQAPRRSAGAALALYLERGGFVKRSSLCSRTFSSDFSRFRSHKNQQTVRCATRAPRQRGRNTHTTLSLSSHFPHTARRTAHRPPPAGARVRPGMVVPHNPRRRAMLNTCFMEIKAPKRRRAAVGCAEACSAPRGGSQVAASGSASIPRIRLARTQYKELPPWPGETEAFLPEMLL